MKQEYSTTPKSVSAMTSLALPKIVSDFPDFQYDEMKERAENVLISYLRAVTAKNLSLLTDGNTELKQQLENHIQMLSVKDLREHSCRSDEGQPRISAPMRHRYRVSVASNRKQAT